MPNFVLEGDDNMGFKGYVTALTPIREADILDMQSDIMRGVGKKVKLSFDPEVLDEKIYLLIEARVGVEYRGAYIHFVLKDELEKIHEFVILGIKEFEYDIFDDHIKYWVRVSDEPLTIPPDGSTSVKVQYGNITHRFFLYMN